MNGHSHKKEYWASFQQEAMVLFEGTCAEGNVKEKEVNIFICNDVLAKNVFYDTNWSHRRFQKDTYDSYKTPTGLFMMFPETRLNPKEMPLLADSFLLMQRLGSAVCAITLNYNLCKYLDLKRTESDKVFFHTFERITEKEAKLIFDKSSIEYFYDYCNEPNFSGFFYKHKKEEYFKFIENNEIADALIQLYHDEIDKEL